MARPEELCLRLSRTETLVRESYCSSMARPAELCLRLSHGRQLAGGGVTAQGASLFSPRSAGDEVA